MLTEPCAQLASLQTRTQGLWCRVKPQGGQLSTTYQGYLSIGTALIILFAVVAPASYFLILFRLRKHLQVRRQAPSLGAQHLRLPCPELPAHVAQGCNGLERAAAHPAMQYADAAARAWLEA